MDILAELIGYLIGKFFQILLQDWARFSAEEEVVELYDEPVQGQSMTMPFSATAERKTGQPGGEIWRRYKAGSLIIMTIFGGLYPGLGGVVGWIVGTNTNQINQTGTMLLNSSGEAAVVSVMLGMLFGFLFGCFAVWRWLRKGGQEAWAVWIHRFVVANILAVAVFFLAFRLSVL